MKLNMKIFGSLSFANAKLLYFETFRSIVSPLSGREDLGESLRGQTLCGGQKFRKLHNSTNISKLSLAKHEFDSMKKTLLPAMIVAIMALLPSCSKKQEPYSVRMVRSEISRNPDALHLDGRQGERKWNYTTGLELLSFMDVADRYGLDDVVAYVREWADTMTTVDGQVYGYKRSAYNVDHICPARIFFKLDDLYGKESPRYRNVVDMIRQQIDTQPRTETGEFWHKKIYPHQVWLDGLYMALPFYAEYTARFAPESIKDSLFADIADQFVKAAENTYDSATRLYRHAWDESRSMFWCDPQTGLSAHAWGRANGWFAAALVDVLDYFPKDNPHRDSLIGLLNHFVEVLPSWADPATGMWYQVLDCPGREGNYLESTCSIMFVYAFLKGLRLGYIDESHSEYILGLYGKFIDTFIRENPDGTISMTSCCSVGGLGGKQMRKGDYEYYLSEPVIENDCKGVGPFIWASLEWEKMN